MNMNIKLAKSLLASRGLKMKATHSYKNGCRCYSVSGWTGEYTLKGILWQLGF